MKTTSFALAATLLAGTALAQTTPSNPTPGNTAPGATSVTPMPGVNPSTGTTPSTGMIDRNSGTAAASGDRNQAVATTSADAAEPASGASSFTEGQARGRIEDRGFAGVTGLTKDDNGVWRGTATKDGASAQVWMDYKGNVGQTGGMRPAAGASTTGTTPAARNADGTTGNPPGTAAGRATDRALGTNTTGANPTANTPDGTPGNPAGTAAGRATDRALGTNTTGTNPGGTNTTGTNPGGTTGTTR